MRNVRLLAGQLCRRSGFSLTECGNVRLKPDLQGTDAEKCQAFGLTALPWGDEKLVLKGQNGRGRGTCFRFEGRWHSPQGQGPMRDCLVRNQEVAGSIPVVSTRQLTKRHGHRRIVPQYGQFRTDRLLGRIKRI